MNGGLEAGSLANWRDGRNFSVTNQALYSGKYGAKMLNNGQIYQNFRTVAGKTYYVSAGVRIDKQIVAPSNGGLLVSVRTSWGWGKDLARSPYLTLSNSPAGTWSQVNFSFVARTTMSTIVFHVDGNGHFEASADDFIVSPNPIPNSYAILTATH